MLFAYVEKCSAEDTPLSVVYAVSGEKNKEGQQVCMYVNNAGLMCVIF